MKWRDLPVSLYIVLYISYPELRIFTTYNLFSEKKPKFTQIIRCIQWQEVDFLIMNFSPLQPATDLSSVILEL